MSKIELTICGEDILTEDGTRWERYEVDRGVPEEPIQCCVCGREVNRGWRSEYDREACMRCVKIHERE